MGPIGCPETSVTNDQSALCKPPEERSFDLHRGGSLKSFVVFRVTKPATECCVGKSWFCGETYGTHKHILCTKCLVLGAKEMVHIPLK